MENPKEMLDYSFVQMEQSLKELTRNALEVATAKKKLEIQRQRNSSLRYQAAKNLLGSRFLAACFYSLTVFIFPSCRFIAIFLLMLL